MPRAFSASAIRWSDVAPVRCISRMIGRTLAAWRSARALMDVAATLRESPRTDHVGDLTCPMSRQKKFQVCYTVRGLRNISRINSR